MRKAGKRQVPQVETEIRSLRRQIARLKSLQNRRTGELLGLKKAVETMQQGVTLKDMRGRILYTNPAEARMHGYSPEELIGKEGRVLGSPEDRRRMTLSQIKRMTSWRRERINIRKDGSTFPAMILSDVIMDGAGRPIEIVTTCKDITERKRAEEDLRNAHDRLHRILGETVHALAVTVEKRDPYTAGHMKRSTQLACAIAQVMGLKEDQIAGLRIAGLLHDIGKITVPAEILSKPGKLAEGELILIKAHAQVGYDILEHIDFPWPVAPTVLQHHERLDGSGYPSGLKDDAIIAEARILAVADVVEAMISHRPYRPTRGLEIALEEVTQQMGILYDRDACEACLSLFREKNFDFEY